MTDPMNTQQHSEATWQQLALSRIESHVSTVEYEMAGLRESVYGALLQFARADESADRQAVNRVRALHKVCTETPLDEGGCEPGDCDEPVCAYDTEAWPCRTIRALEEGKQ